jgi:hypothetical protein
MLGEGVSRLNTQTKKYILTAITIMTMRANGETFLVEAHTPQ